MQPLKLSSYKLAKELGVTAPSVNEIVRRRRPITAEMALRQDPAEFIWVNTPAGFRRLQELDERAPER